MAFYKFRIIIIIIMPTAQDRDENHEAREWGGTFPGARVW